MSNPVKRRKAVTKAASANEPKSSSQEAAFVTVDLATDERTSVGAAGDARTAGRRAQVRQDLQAGRFPVIRGQTSNESQDRCPAPGLTRTAERALSSHCKKESTMPAKLPPSYIGLDIAKDQLDYCLSDTVEGHCAYTPEGCAELIKKLRQIKHARVICCEASGGYEKLIVAELLHAGLEVCVVQPGRVRAISLCRRAHGQDGPHRCPPASPLRRKSGSACSATH